MVQQWIDGVDPASMVDLFVPKEMPAGWRPVFRALDASGEFVLVAHADDPRLQLLAAFDLVVNNADRKGSHVLPVIAGPVYGVDHGLTMHVETKLRTVLWGWAGEPLPDEAVEGMHRLLSQLDGELREDLADLLTLAEIGAFQARLKRLLRKPVFDQPPQRRTAIPWPPL
jgi:uncharacterized repeat protein (TIGR03843 family)